MKKIISVLFLVFSMMLASHAVAAVSNFEYYLDVELPNPNGIVDESYMIMGMEFEVFGGNLDENWTYVLGDAVPVNEGSWIFENYGGAFSAIYDDYSGTDYTPLFEGRVITIFSDTELTFEGLTFFDFKNRDVDPEYFRTYNRK